MEEFLGSLGQFELEATGQDAATQEMVSAIHAGVFDSAAAEPAAVDPLTQELVERLRSVRAWMEEDRRLQGIAHEKIVAELIAAAAKFGLPPPELLLPPPLAPATQQGQWHQQEWQPDAASSSSIHAGQNWQAQRNWQQDLQPDGVPETPMPAAPHGVPERPPPAAPFGVPEPPPPAAKREPRRANKARGGQNKSYYNKVLYKTIEPRGPALNPKP